MQGYEPRIYVAIPAVNEKDYLPATIRSLDLQSSDYKLVICVNQPDHWWDDTEYSLICENNQKTLEWLQTLEMPNLEIIDRSSRGSGWDAKHFGVGWARKTLFDHIAEVANSRDIVVSLDADTLIRRDYLQSIKATLMANPESVALSVPYYHKLTGDEARDRAILHYEIYMRYYAINLWRINNPYAFTAIGSAIAFPVWAYNAIGGMKPHKSGEDFYLLQKLRKYGTVLTYNPEKVYPAARYSDRVGFGTGPAMIKGSQGMWDSYPIYPEALFDEVKETTDVFAELFEHDVETPMDAFLQGKFADGNMWKSLRENYKSEEQFVSACHKKVDALRILQYMKWRHSQQPTRDEEQLLSFIMKYFSNNDSYKKLSLLNFSFKESAIEKLDAMRCFLLEIEEDYQKRNG